MEDLNPSEISKIIKDRINKLDVSAEESNEGTIVFLADGIARVHGCLLYTSPSPRDKRQSRMPSSA